MGDPSPLRVLYVDDEQGNLSLFELQFGRELSIVTASSAEAALQILAEGDIGVLLSDERMPGMSGVELLALAADRFKNTVRVIVSAYSDAERLLGAINKGHAHEYLLKPWQREELHACILRGLEISKRRRHLSAQAAVAEVYSDALAQRHDASALVGSGLKAVLHTATRAAASDATVLIQGETGTGKELLARYIHNTGPRARLPFIRVNCGALSEGLLESELFGHEKGAFTGAHQMRLGRFELAKGGTIFLDEIGDVSPKLQVSLLRVLQEKEIERVGGATPLKVDVRVIAATHQDLEKEVREGSFREDLFYRLNVLSLTMPPLRDRLEDLPALVTHFVAKHSNGTARCVPDDVVAALQRYSWPGNVRELENVVQRALVMGASPTLELDDFCLRFEAPAREVREEARAAESDQLRALLLTHGGNCARAARALGVPRTTFVSKARKHGLL